MASQPVAFTISVVGEKTNTTWHGEFKAKPLLSHRDELVRDSRRREFLGGVNPQFADPRQLNQADIFAELSVRLTSAPAFWSDSGGGLDLLDDNVVAEVYKHAVRIENEELARIKKAADEAQAALRKVDPQG